MTLNAKAPNPKPDRHTPDSKLWGLEPHKPWTLSPNALNFTCVEA